MLRRRLPALLPALALLGGAGLTGCTSSSPAPAKTHSTAASASSTAPTTGGTSVAPSTVAAKLQAGLAGATSAHLAVSTALSGQTLKGDGDLALDHGAIARADLQQDLPSGLGTIRVIVDGAKTYAKLPAALNPDSSKPWVLLTPDSKSIVVSQLASTVAPVLAVASPASLIAFAQAASSATDLGAGTADGTATTRYRLIVDAAKLPATLPSSITAGGRSTIPVDVSLDSTGRPRQVSGTFSISGQTVTPTIALSDYDAPVSISPPPVGQVSTQ